MTFGIFLSGCTRVFGVCDCVRCSGVVMTKGVIGCSWPTCLSHRCSTVPKFHCYSTTSADTLTTRASNSSWLNRSKSLRDPSVSCRLHQITHTHYIY